MKTRVLAAVALLPLLIVLALIAALLAGICLPDWNKIGGPVGQTVAPVKEKIVGAVSSVKNMIFPEEEALKSFAATAADDEAPTQVFFTVQTAKNVEAIRIVDDFGDTVYYAAYSAEMEASQEVIANSNALLWKPSCDVLEGYAGGYSDRNVP